MDVNLDSVVQRLPAIVYVYFVNHTTGESGFHFVSDYVKTMFGYTPQEVYEDGTLLVNAIIEDEAEEYAAAVIESMVNLTPFDRLGRMRRSDGQIMDVHYQSTPRLVEETNPKDGSVTKLTVWDGVACDVTIKNANDKNNRKAVEETVRDSMQPIFEIDTRGNIRKWNTAMSTVTGYSSEEAVGQPVTSFMLDEEHGNFCSFVSKATNQSEDESSQQIQRVDCVFVSKNERKHVFLHAKCTCSKDSNLCHLGLLCCCQDITKVKEAEKQKDDALKLVDAERGLTEWLSHEVRNPLSVAMEAAIALQDGEDDKENYTELICESIRYIVDLLTNMLDLNKCMDGKISLCPSKSQVRKEVLIPTCKIMGVRNEKVKLILEEGGEVEGWVDKLRLRQVITNLVANSLKFTEDGFVKIKLEKVVGEKQTCMRISVADSGCGIDPGDYNLLFSKWESIGSQVNGAGIGLCLSRSLVKAMGGTLSLDKDYTSGFKSNKGARFIVELPLSSMLSAESNLPTSETLSAAVRASNRIKRALDPEVNEEASCSDAVETAKKSKSSSDTRSETKAVRGKFNLLIVDDDVVGRRLLTRRFQRLFPDANVTEVASGEEALKETETSTFDIITVDHFMAVDEMNGAETIKALRDRYKDACIVGISGNSKRAEHLEAGAQDFFQKPIPADDVLLDRLVTKISPPSGWKVLCVDDVELNVRMMSRRLNKVAAPHFMSLQEASKRWEVTTRLTGEEAMDLLEKEWFDLVIVDQHLGDGASGTSVAKFVREHALNRDALIVLNSGSVLRRAAVEEPYNLFWPKPLPSTEQMRLDLCRALVSSSSSNAGEHLEDKKYKKDEKKSS